jgi:hypothetical protein
MTRSIRACQRTPQWWSNQDTQVSKLLNLDYHKFSLGNLRQTLIWTAIACLGCWGQVLPAVANPPQLVAQDPSPPETPNNNSIDISPEIINSSPVLQKWLKGVPDVSNDIKTDPSFRTRVKIGYSQYPSTNQAGGFHLAVDDLFFGRGGLSASANYNSSSTGNRTAYGADAQYYLLPLGGYVNVTPLVGFRRLETDKYKRDGLNLGVKVMVVPARGGGADLALSQSWVGFGSATETGLTTLSVGYALTNHLRLSTDIQQQNAKENYDSRVGFGVEWMP